MEPERVTARQIEAARRALTRHMKRAGRVWIRIFPDVPVSKKPLEVRMGSGKGTPELWVARVEPGRILFEIDGVTVAVAKEALALAAAKLPIKTRFVERIASRRDMKAGRHQSDDQRQIDDEVLKLKKEQFNLRFQRATGQLENTVARREVRRDIARLKTVAQNKRAGAPKQLRGSKMPKRTLKASWSATSRERR